MILVELFWTFCQIGAFTIGGGLASLPLIKQYIVDGHQWLSLVEFTDLITIAEMTPGPIGLNAATFVGTRVAGFSGAVVATLGCIFPSCIIVSLLGWLYFRYKNLSVMQGVLAGLRPAIVALVASAGVAILVLALWGEAGFSPHLQALNPVSVGLFIVSIFILKKWAPNPVWVIIGCGLIGGFVYLVV